jgi:hypothetical protein
MLPSDLWQAIGSPQLAELTALVSLSLPFLLKLRRPPRLRYPILKKIYGNYDLIHGEYFQC